MLPIDFEYNLEWTDKQDKKDIIYTLSTHKIERSVDKKAFFLGFIIVQLSI